MWRHRGVENMFDKLENNCRTFLYENQRFELSVNLVRQFSKDRSDDQYRCRCKDCDRNANFSFATEIKLFEIPKTKVLNFVELFWKCLRYFSNSFCLPDATIPLRQRSGGAFERRSNFLFECSKVLLRPTIPITDPTESKVEISWRKNW